MVNSKKNIPLAERMRPIKLEDFIGQRHLLENGKPLSSMVRNKAICSMIFWGPPGTGKTSLAQLIAAEIGCKIEKISAQLSGVKDVKELISKFRRENHSIRPLLFIDEIHRFNKSQQDSLLDAVEKGDIVLIGATTENPIFEVNAALLSRCFVYQLQKLTTIELELLATKAIKYDALLSTKNIKIETLAPLINAANGDGRKLLNLIEMICHLHSKDENIIIDNQTLTLALQNPYLNYDKKGKEHYDTISAFIKSVRGSDPNASIYYLAKLLVSGEDPKFIARRLCILAAEDIGLANPNALLLSNACFDIIHKIGMPEARIPLSELTIYLASSPKSNSAYLAINKAMEQVSKDGNLSIPSYLINSANQIGMVNSQSKYQYPHDNSTHFVHQIYLPDNIKNKNFYHPANNIAENNSKERLNKWWKNYYQF